MRNRRATNVAQQEYDRAYAQENNKTPEHKMALKKWLKTPNGKKYKKAKDFRCRTRITLEQKEEMFVSQGSVCKSCGKDHPGKNHKWQIDHIHGTKIIRGIICNRCNTLAGNGSPEHLKQLKQVLHYIQNWKKM
jgi:hypothetical protein